MPALIFAVDFAVWNEAGPTENAVVSGCRFEKCAISRGGAALGAIVVKADHDGGENDRPAGIHRNVRFLDNTFEDCGSSGIYVAATDGVELGGNAFRRCSSNPNVEGFNRFDIRLKNCRNVRLEKNVSDRKSLVVADPPLSNVSGTAGDGSGKVGPEAQSHERVLLDPHVNPPDALKDLRLHLGDPYVLYEDGVYYAYGSLGTDKGFTVCVSRDLKTWKMDQGRAREGRVFTKGDGYGESRFWAPECHKYRGRYYLFYSADHGCAVAVGDSPLGPFANPTKEPLVREGRYENGDAMLCIDNSLVLAENGDPWMVYSRGGRACLVRLTEDLQHVLPETSFFLFGDLEPWQHGIEEGPFILRENNRWYCFFSGDDCRSPDYSVGVGVADSLRGPWRRIHGYRFLHRVGGLTGTGHGTPFKDAAGLWRYIFHAHYSREFFGPRCTYVNRFRFDSRSGRPELLTDDRPLPCRITREMRE